MDSEPPLKRRRTSPSGSDDSARSRSRSRSRRRSTSIDTPKEDTTNNPDQDQQQQYRQRSPSADYTPRTHSPFQSDQEQNEEQEEYSPAPAAAAAAAPTSSNPPPSRPLFLPLHTLPAAHARGITSAKFSPDGLLLATGSADASIKIFSTAQHTFKHIRTLTGHKAGINALSWSPTTTTTQAPSPSYTLASASDDKSVLLWSPLSSDKPIRPSPLTGHSNYVYSLAFSPKGNMLVTGSYDEAVFLWDVRSARVMRQLPAHSDPVSGVDFVRDGTMVASCASDGLIRIWDAGTGQCLKTLVHEDRRAVTSVRFAPNGRFVLAWTLDSCIRLWRYLGVDGGGCVKTYQGHVNRSYSLGGTIGEYACFTASGDGDGDDGTTIDKRIEAFVASGSEDGDVVVWDINSKEVLWRTQAHSDVVLCVDWARGEDGRGMLASVGKDRTLKVWVENVDVGALAPEVKFKEDMEIQGHMVQLEIKREDSEMAT